MNKQIIAGVALGAFVATGLGTVYTAAKAQTPNVQGQPGQQGGRPGCGGQGGPVGGWLPGGQGGTGGGFGGFVAHTGHGVGLAHDGVSRDAQCQCRTQPDLFRDERH